MIDLEYRSIPAIVDIYVSHTQTHRYENVGVEYKFSKWTFLDYFIVLCIKKMITSADYRH